MGRPGRRLYPAVGCGYGLSCGRACFRSTEKTPGTSIFRIYISRRKCLSGSYFQLRDFDVKKEWILFNHGVNTGNNIAARALGGTIMVATPMYPHINQKLPQEAGKPVIRVPLKQENGLYTFVLRASGSTDRQPLQSDHDV